MQSEAHSENWDFGPRAFREMAWYAEADAPAGVPVLDLAAMDLGALREAVTGSGFLYVKNHGIREDALEAIANETRAFYGQPEATKRQFDHRAQIRGYTGYRVESTARLFASGHGKDLCMKYTMGPELSAAEVRARITSEDDLASNAYSPNVFPNPYFRAAWIHYYEVVHRASIALLEAIGEALELGADARALWRQMLIERSCGELRYLQYPDVPRAACADLGADRMAAHFDLDVITLLHQTPCDNGFVSLEAKARDEAFYKVPAIRGTLVVNLGEVLRLLTGGLVKATVHRVVRPPVELHRGSARDVTVFFQAPPLNADLRPITFGGDVGRDTLFEDLYRVAGPGGAVRFSQLRARLFDEFIRHMNAPAAEHEHDAALFTAPAA